MKLAAILACRNQSSRLYAKPLQNLDVERGVSILDYLVAQLQQRLEIDDIVLCISEREENAVYRQKSAAYGIPFVVGDERDVLRRLILGAERVGADHVFRVTTESPFPYLGCLPSVWQYHQEHALDYSGVFGLPDGASFQIIRTDALRASWEKGDERHRSELCGLYIREHPEEFHVMNHPAPLSIDPQRYRLTVDWPEDLVVMRAIYAGIGLSPAVPLDFPRIISFLDAHPEINRVNNWIDAGVGRAWYMNTTAPGATGIV
ncbi:MAG: acylneuraminate cytidylyltransferase [bacterium]|nr:acylneuraminate cytidylyltransferase [bacterium]